jgi:DNA-binding beta-propeller fold protein YncE
MKSIWLILGVLIAITAIAVAWATWDTAGGTANPGPIIPPVGPVLLANNQGSGTTTMIEVRTGRLVAHIPVGDGPHEIAASPDSRWAVVTLPGDSSSFSLFGNTQGNKLAVIEVATASLKRTIDLGEYASPHGVAFLSDNRTVAVTSEPRHAVVLVDIESGALLGSISAGSNAGPYLLALSRDRKRIYTANIESSTVGEMDIAARKLLRTIPAPGVPEGIAVSPDGDTAWLVESLKTRTLAVLDLKTGAAIAAFDGFVHPHRVGLSPDGSVALVTDGKGNEIRIYDALNRRELGRVSTGEGSGPNGLFFAPDSKLAYVTLSGGEIAELELSSRSVLRRFKTTQSRPDGVVYVPRD